MNASIQERVLVNNRVEGLRELGEKNASAKKVETRSIRLRMDHLVQTVGQNRCSHQMIASDERKDLRQTV